MSFCARLGIVLVCAGFATSGARASYINNEGFIKPQLHPSTGPDYISKPNTPSNYWVYEAANVGSSDSGIAHTNTQNF